MSVDVVQVAWRQNSSVETAVPAAGIEPALTFVVGSPVGIKSLWDD